MARQINPDDLTTAWRALAGVALQEGWRTISLGGHAKFQIRAGRHFPGNDEAVLVGLNLKAPPNQLSLPSGTGFSIKLADLGSASDGLIWFGLARQPAGRVDFFTMMAADVVSTVIADESLEMDGILAAFLGRVRAWQSFMERDRDGILSPEAEVGLHGELVFLLEIIKRGLNSLTAVEGWQGPLDGLQDFQFPAGAIEVKTTISAGTFPATIASLEQLDDKLLPSLFLAGVRLRLGADGLNLLQRVEVLRSILGSDPAALACFENRLLHAGFSAAFADRYPRMFSYNETKLWLVKNDFPRLTHGNIPAAVRKARYEIDLELISSPCCQVHDALKMTGAY